MHKDIFLPKVLYYAVLQFQPSSLKRLNQNFELITIDSPLEDTLEFLREHVDEGCAPLCGNSIWKDRQFLDRYMPEVSAYLHYRLVDVSTIKELGRRWYPSELTKLPKKKEMDLPSYRKQQS